MEVRLHWIFAIEAGQTVIFLPQAGGLNQSFQAKIIERVQAQIVGNLGHRSLGGD
jgi:hypothetical protein